MAPRLVLIGPMGAGKTTVGRAIAKTLACEFADTDALIEADQGKSVSEKMELLKQDRWLGTDYFIPHAEKWLTICDSGKEI